MIEPRRHFRCFYTHSDGSLLLLDFLCPDLDSFIDLRDKISDSLPDYYVWCLEIVDLFDE